MHEVLKNALIASPLKGDREYAKYTPDNKIRWREATLMEIRPRRKEGRKVTFPKIKIYPRIHGIIRLENFKTQPVQKI